MDETTVKAGKERPGIKNILRLLGYPIFGEQVRGAVLAFQNDHNLPGSGELDDNTVAALYRAYEQRTGVRNMPVAEGTPPGQEEQFPPVMPGEKLPDRMPPGPSMEGTEMSPVPPATPMDMLPPENMGYPEMLWPEMPPPAMPLPHTTAPMTMEMPDMAGTQMQLPNLASPPPTWLREEAAEQFPLLDMWVGDEMEESSAPLEAPESIPPSRPMLRRGSSGPYVTQVQTALKVLGHLTASADGVFGPMTESAVRDFQRANRIRVDGIVGPETWGMLDRVLARSAPTRPMETGFDLKPGDRGVYVIALQLKLKACGYYTGPISGALDEPTILAVRAFQRDMDLPEMGRVNVAMWKMLDDIYYDNLPPADESRILRLGSTGEDVFKVQTLLRLLGYYLAQHDGIFGVATQEAVRQFQMDHGLQADGIIGPKTWDLLDRVNISPCRHRTLPQGVGQQNEMAAPNTQGVAAQAQAVPAMSRLMRQGARGEDVADLQRRLQQLGYYHRKIDGIFGFATKDAVRRFQQANHIRIDGVVGPITRQVLEGTEMPTPSNPVLREGMTGEFVTLLQNKLKDLGYYQGDVTGAFDSVTLQALQQFQRDNQLPPDGMTGSGTWARLLEESDEEDSQPTLSRCTKPTLRFGDKGPYVRQLQTALRHLRFYQGRINGMFGRRTEAAVKALQRANRLRTDGVVDCRTWERLDALYPRPLPREWMSENIWAEQI